MSTNVRDAGHRPRPLVSDPRSYGQGVPHAEFARLRARAPVVWVEEAGRGAESGFWAVLGHAAVEEASRASDVLSSSAKGAFLRDSEGGRQLLVNMDGPEHVRVRRYVSSAFVPSAVASLRDGVAAHTQATVSRLAAGEPFDVVRDLAAEVPLLVLADLLGIPRDDRHVLFDWSNRLVGFDDPEYGGGSVQAYERTMMEIFRYGLDVATDRRRSPRPDLVTRILTTEVDGRRMTESEFCHLWLLLVIAGHETSRHAISGAIAALAERPAERARLAAAGELVPSAVEELLRWVTPIMQFRRTAVRDTELAGQPIARGDKVVLFFVSANRDGTVFADPERFDVGRTPNPHLAFGIGPHYCLGAHLVRLELAVLLDALRPHLDRLELLGPPVHLESNFMNGIKRLSARFAPR